MLKKSLFFGSAVLLLTVLLVFSGCSSDGDDDPEPDPDTPPTGFDVTVGGALTNHDGFAAAITAIEAGLATGDVTVTLHEALDKKLVIKTAAVGDLSNVPNPYNIVTPGTNKLTVKSTVLQNHGILIEAAPKVELSGIGFSISGDNNAITSHLIRESDPDHEDYYVVLVNVSGGDITIKDLNISINATQIADPDSADSAVQFGVHGISVGSGGPTQYTGTSPVVVNGNTITFTNPATFPVDVYTTGITSFNAFHSGLSIQDNVITGAVLGIDLEGYEGAAANTILADKVKDNIIREGRIPTGTFSFTANSYRLYALSPTLNDDFGDDFGAATGTDRGVPAVVSNFTNALTTAKFTGTVDIRSSSTREQWTFAADGDNITVTKKYKGSTDWVVNPSS